MHGGGRILILEDEPLVLIELEDALVGLGYTVAGAARTLSQAIDLISAKALDAAVLDVNISGHFSTPVADLLSQRNIPIVFATGYTSERLPAPYEHHPRVSKPYDRTALDQALQRVLAENHSL